MSSDGAGTDPTDPSIGVNTDGISTASTIEVDTISVVEKLLYKSVNNCASGTGDLTALMMAHARPSLRTTAAPPSPIKNIDIYYYLVFVSIYTRYVYTLSVYINSR